MTAEAWRVIVDWATELEARSLLEEWLRTEGVDEGDIADELRMDVARTVSGRATRRYSIRVPTRASGPEGVDVSDLDNAPASDHDAGELDR